MVAGVKSDLGRDLALLRRLAFRRIERVGDVVKEVHAVRDTHPNHPGLQALEVVRRWLLMPFTLWPVDFVGLGRHLTSEIRNGKDLRPEVLFLLEQVSELPKPKVQRAIAAHELQVEKGRYERVITREARLKYREKVKQTSDNPAFRKEWQQLKSLFNLRMGKGEKRVIRRRMVQERNFRNDWEFRDDDDKLLFKAAFDAFCHRWNLYGMEGDKPLVLKLSVNLTAHGTMIVVPAYWSLNTAKDLDWSEIMKLHRPRVAMRQGPVLSQARMDRRNMAKKTRLLWEKLKRKGIKGDELYQQIKKGLGVLPSFTDREIRRLKQEAMRLQNP